MPQVENPNNLDLPQQVNQVLSVMFADYRQVIIRKRFGSSFGGGWVIEVQPIRADQKPELRMVVKLAAITIIQKEWNAYQQHIHQILPNVAEVIDQPVLLPEIGWGGLRYKMMGGGGTFEVISLSEYCLQPEVTLDNIRDVFARLFRIMHKVWGFQHVVPEFNLRRSYDRLLPVNLLIEHSLSSTEGRLSAVGPETRLTPGDRVRLEGFAVIKVDFVKQMVTLRPIQTGAVDSPYRVRLKSQHIEQMATYTLDQEIEPLEGRVIETRPSRLHDEMQRVLGHSFDPAHPMIELPDKIKLANPLPNLSKILSATRNVKVATIHGDFNLENILIEPETGSVSLIDFAEAREDHILHDCFRLETEVILKLIPPVLQQQNLSPIETIAGLYWRLHQTVFLDSPDHRPLPSPALEKPLAILTAIRRTARPFFYHFDEVTEYYQGLTLYLLGALKFRIQAKVSEQPQPKQVAVWAGIVAYQFLIFPGDNNPSRPPSSLIPLLDAAQTEQSVALLPPQIGHTQPDGGLSEALTLTDYERAYRDRLKDYYVEDADYYIELKAETTEIRGQPDETPAPRSLRRRRRRHRAEYAQWIQTEQSIELVKLNTLQEAVEKYPCVILLGDPGAGKTTALEYLAYQYAEPASDSEAALLPIPLRLSEFGPGMTLETFIQHSWGGPAQSNYWDAPELAANLTPYLEAGRLFFLFDALNEMPRDGYQERVVALRHFIDRWSPHGNRFLVTCRVLDYGHELNGLQRVEIQPLNDLQIIRFLQNELGETAETLWEILTETKATSVERRTIIHRSTSTQSDQRSLLAMARNPYLLTMMIDIFAKDGHLSQNRAVLMTRFTQILMNWAKEKCPPSAWLDADIQVEALSVLAFETQRRSGFGTLVKTDQVKTVMPQQVQPDPNWPAVPSPPDQVLTLAANANIIEMPVDRSSVRFYHQLLQEYFAACQMLKEEPASLASLWRWPWLETDMPSTERESSLSLVLPPPPPTGWEETTILAATLGLGNDEQLLQTLIEVNPILAGRCLHEGRLKAVNEHLWQAVIEALLITISRPEVALSVRIAAGEIVGHLGDPRLGEMVVIPAGEFMMGNDSDQGPADQQPQHSLSLPAYEFGKYPVTFAEFAAFVEAGGYKDKRWWTSAGWSRKRSEKWTRPKYWAGHFNRPNRPVIGVSWYECVAYCRWLSAETGQIYRLPTEAEWEKAARGVDGRLYPWGDRFESNRLNTKMGKPRVMTLTSIGVYPDGVSPCGAFDCAGNVWEWNATQAPQGKFKGYPYDATENEWHKDYLESEVARVLRGGSWYDDDRSAKVVFRYQSRPEEWFLNRGFRLVRSL